jgi:hypothetical protein
MHSNEPVKHFGLVEELYFILKATSYEMVAPIFCRTFLALASADYSERVDFECYVCGKELHPH